MRNDRDGRKVEGEEQQHPRGALPFAHSLHKRNSRRSMSTDRSTVTVRIHFDGGCSPNPGKGYGSYEIESEIVGLNHRVLRQKFGEMTNNMAEWNALLCALEWLTDFGHIPTDVPILIFTDSMLVCRQLRGKWKCKLWYLRKLRDQCLELLKPFDHSHIEWVSRVENVRRFGH